MKLIHTQSLAIGYIEGGTNKVLQENINLSLSSGEIISLMGQNGVGKTTFIKTLSGLHKGISGSVYHNDRLIDEFSKSSLAKQISVVLTEKPFTAHLSVIELIALGRHPYSNWLGRLNTSDKQAIDLAMSQTNIDYLARKKLYQLSDGQFQKVMIARALAQETDLIILDEPTAHLDLSNKIEIMLLLKSIAGSGKGVLIATHDLQVSLQLSDRLWLFNFNQPVLDGCPEDLILQGAIDQTLFPINNNIDLTTGTVKNLDEHKGNVLLQGDPTMVHWTAQALQRNGYAVNKDSPTSIIINCLDYFWKLKSKDTSTSFDSIEDLLMHLK
ncbi:MAG: ABC transporter ATP-binding protein [Cyclobacteriaceae bacterium]|nr:ABC transporter ATP-binding protein [Cyclobacteriaceae bacterium]